MRGIEGSETIMANTVQNIIFRSDTTMKQGEFEEYTCDDGKVVVVKWLDNRVVTLTSTCVEPAKCCSKEKKTYVDVPARTIVWRYNACMGGVKICDRLLEYCWSAIKTRKWTLKVTLHVNDLSLVNCWMEYDACRMHAVPRRNTMDLLDFRLAVAEALCSTPKRKTSIPGEEVDFSNDHIEQPYKVAKLPGGDTHLNVFDHLPTVDNLKTARASRLVVCDLWSRARCEK